MKKVICSLVAAVSLLALSTPCHAASTVAPPDNALTYDQLVWIADCSGMSIDEVAALLDVPVPDAVSCYVGNVTGWP